MLWSAAIIAAPVLVQRIIDEAIPRRDVHLLTGSAAGILFCVAAATALFMLQGHLAVTASENILLGLRRRLVERILAQSVDFFRRFPPGDLTSRFSNDAQFVAESLYEHIVRSLVGVIYPVLLVAVMVTWNPRLGLIALLTIPVYAVYVRAFQSALSRESRRAKEALSEQTDVFLDLVEGAPVIRAFQQGQSAAERFSGAARRYTLAAVRAARLADWTRTGVDMIGLLVTYLPVIAGGFLMVQADQRTLTVGTLVVYYTYLRLLTTRLLLIFQGLTRIAAVYPSLARLRELLDYPLPARVEEHGIEDAPASTDVELVGVDFSYPGGPPVLQGFDLRVAAGEKVAIMGPSGCGKSTLLHLLMRMVRPSRGRVLFGGRDVDEYSLPFYLSFFSSVGQKTHLFRISVRENVALGWYHVPAELVEEAVAAVRMHDCVQRLPQGYDTVLGRGGLALSGGQAQRLALARAMIRTPAVLLLDEFTSALDEQVEREILADLLRAFSSATIICVTHSERVAAHFERVVRLRPVQEAEEAERAR